MDDTDPVENYLSIRKEIEVYDTDLAERPEIVAVSNAELPGAEEVRQQLASAIDKEVLLFSSVTGEGLKDLMRQSYQILADQRLAT